MIPELELYFHIKLKSSCYLISQLLRPCLEESIKSMILIELSLFLTIIFLKKSSRPTSGEIMTGVRVDGADKASETR